MLFFATISIFIAALSLSEGKMGTVCHNDTECGTHECCYIEPEFLIVSRRDVPLTIPDPGRFKKDTGVCEGYRALHERCGPLEKMNGHCSCGSQMSCQFVPAPTDTLVASKRKIYMPGPGAYQCEMTK